MTQQDTGQRRRQDDFRLNPQGDELYPGVDRRRRSGNRASRAPGRSFLRRFKHPIIGLSIAGAMAPLINAGTQADATQPAAPRTEADLARGEATPATAGDAEEQLAQRIGSEQRETQRASLVGSAMKTFDIDEKLASDIYTIAQQEGLDPKLGYGLVKTESSFRNTAVSHVGARGLTQVMPRTAKWLVPGTKANDLHDQKTNLRLGFRYLNQLIDKYQGNVRLALLAYNRGPGTVDKVLRRGGDPNNGYADKVLRGADEAGG